MLLLNGLSIIQSDNDREFVNKLIEEVLASWPGSVQCVSGRPRHPQSHGLVEQAHYTNFRERMLRAKIAECGSKSPPWTRWLPYIGTFSKELMSNVDFSFIEMHGQLSSS